MCIFLGRIDAINIAREEEIWKGHTNINDKQFRVMVAFGHIDLLLSMHGEGQSNRMIWSAKATGLCCRDTLFFQNHGSVENGYITIWKITILLKNTPTL